MNFQTIKQFFDSTTTRLALSYLAIIMLMSIGFSIVFYKTSSHELGRQLPPHSLYRQTVDSTMQDSLPDVDHFFRDRIKTGRAELAQKLIWVNVCALIGGGFISYYLARRTLQPIEANMEAQAQFVSDASHELRTPLTLIQTSTEVALRKPKLTAAEAKKVLEQNVADVRRLQDLTNGLLAIAKHDKSKLVLTPTSLQEVTSEALNHVVAVAQQKDITVDEQVINLKVLGNKAALIQALTVLLDNAIKYSPNNSTIRITSGLEGGCGFVHVKDEGKGIEAKDLPHIFDRFYRADHSRSSQNTEGFGIGLSLAKKIIDQHHGEIIARSAPGKGSIFSIKLPLA